ncbi:hypothetical protein DXB18_07895 [Clostridium sp. OM02-18AC]|nr:hypothetical protein DWZ40_12240 [Clostridium sp. AF32-12BH]RHV66226.1 hypothetical protein DXB18_07895 [Clostridium sp. OM02-18AC]
MPYWSGPAAYLKSVEMSKVCCVIGLEGILNCLKNKKINRGYCKMKSRIFNISVNASVQRYGKVPDCILQ